MRMGTPFRCTVQAAHSISLTLCAPRSSPHAFSSPQVEQACHTLSSLAMEDALIAHLVRADVLSAICSLLHSDQPEILVSVLRVIANLALAADSVSARLCNATTVPVLIDLCHSPHMMVRQPH